MKKTRSNPKKQKILELLKIGKKPSFIAKQLDVPVQTVYSVKWLAKKDKTYTVTATGSLNVAKKRSRPSKVPLTKEQTANKLSQIPRLIQDNVQLMDDNRFLLSDNENLRHQIVGFRAVISYLENQVGLRNSQ